MNARTALQNYARTMTKLYGSDFMEHMSTDDRETFDILARRARVEMDKPSPKNWERSAYLRRVLGIRTEPKKTYAADRFDAWTKHVTEHGNGISGVLRRSYDSYGNPIMVAGEGAHGQKRKSAAYISGVTAADLLASVNNS